MRRRDGLIDRTGYAVEVLGTEYGQRFAGTRRTDSASRAYAPGSIGAEVAGGFTGSQK
jgi:hypothetical protein